MPLAVCSHGALALGRATGHLQWAVPVAPAFVRSGMRGKNPSSLTENSQENSEKYQWTCARTAFPPFEPSPELSAPLADCASVSRLVPCQASLRL